MTTACIYLRFSDDSQIGNTSFEVQEEKCRDACKREEWDIFPHIIKDEAVSADALKRDKTHRVIDLLNFCKENKGKFQILMVYNTDRFARDVADHMWLRRELRALDIVLRSATEKLGESPTDKFLEVVLAGKNELDNDVRRVKATDGLWKRVEQGLWPWAPPFGYKVVLSYDDMLRPHVPDDTCSWVIPEIFKKYASGTISKVQLAREYKSKEIRNYKDKVVKFSPQLIDIILRKNYYAGWLSHVSKGEIKGLHTPLIDRALFDKCQKEVIEKSNNRAKYRLRLNPDFPLRHFAKCPSCNGYLTAAMQKKQTYPLYWCCNKKCAVSWKTIKRADLHTAFTDYLSHVKPTERQVEKFQSGILAKYAKLSEGTKELYKSAMKKIQDLQSETEWIKDKSKKGIFTDEEFKIELEKNRLAISLAISLAKGELNDIYQEEVNIEEMLSKAAQFIRTLELAWLEAPIAVQDRLQRFIFPSGVVYENGG